MKRAVLAFCLVLIAAAASSTEFSYSTLVPKTAKSMAMGGVFTTVPSSEFSFFGNPAFFSENKSSFALPTLSAWSYGRPSEGLDRFAETLSAYGGTDFVRRSFDIMSEGGSSGGGASAGLTLVGKGVGLGLFTTTDNYIKGSNYNEETVRSDTETTLILGLGFPSELGSAKLSIGGDIRPFYHVRLCDQNGDDPSLPLLLAEGSSNLYAEAFFGAALDLGASLSFGSLSVGLTLRDLAPTYPVATEKLPKIQSSLGSGNMPDTSSSSLFAKLTPSISAGLSWAPGIAPGAVDPVFYLEAQDIVGVAFQWDGASSFLELLHAGAELKLFKTLSLRGGLNRGRVSAGAGVKLFFLDLNAAIFTEELGALPGDDSRSGLALQAVIRL